MGEFHKLYAALCPKAYVRCRWTNLTAGFHSYIKCTLDQDIIVNFPILCQFSVYILVIIFCS